jgi:hypothetical protein
MLREMPYLGAADRTAPAIIGCLATKAIREQQNMKMLVLLTLFIWFGIALIAFFHKKE